MHDLAGACPRTTEEKIFTEGPMTTQATAWDETPLKPGPIALAAESMPGEGLVLLATSTACGGAVHVTAGQAAAFLACHREELFVSNDVAAVHGQLAELFGGRKGGASALEELWSRTRVGRWVDLRLLDRQVRLAVGDNDYRLRGWKEIVVSRHTQGGGESVVAERNQTSSDEASPRQEELRLILDVFESLRAEATSIAAEDPLLPLPTFPDIPPAREGGLLGHWFEVQAAVGIGLGGLPALAVTLGEVPELLARVTGEFRRASAILARKAEDVRGCFRWTGDEVACVNGYPDVRRDRLRHWLRKAFDGLCDAQKGPPDVPRDAEGRPPVNPERWGFWAGCDESLWAWRQLFRMAEVARIINADGRASPRYETIPLLRSLEPNLSVYRSLGVRVFRPREGRVFLAGRLHGLRIRCLAGVCIRRGYAAHGQCRLLHFLQANDPLEAIAGELFAHAAAATEEPGGVDAAARLFAALRENNPERYRYWTELAVALLEATPLGLPPVYLTAILRNDFALEDLAEPDVRRYQQVFVERVTQGLCSFLEDGTPEVINTRLGLGKDGFWLYEDEKNTGTTGAAVRNALAMRRRRHFVSEFVSGDNPRSASDPQGRKGLYQYRAWTLGGRLTSRAASAAVRRQELRMAVEEVLVAVVHDLCAAGFHVLGMVGDEFLLEVPSDGANRAELARVAQIACDASRRILWELEAPVVVTPVEAW
jgi:hypothetical protein